MAYVRDLYTKSGISVPQEFDNYNLCSFHARLGSRIYFPALSLQPYPSYYAIGDTTLVFSSELYDTNSDYNTSTGYFTAPFDGLYAFTASATFVRFGSSSSGTDRLGIALSMIVNSSPSGWGTTYPYHINQNNNVLPDTRLTINMAHEYELSQNDTVRVTYQVRYGDATANTTWIESGVSTHFTGTFLRSV